MQPERIARLPGKDGEAVFDAPWQARAFALAVQLNEAGHLCWQDWSTRLAARIKAAEGVAAVKTNDDYYRLWVETIEELYEAREPSAGD